MRYLIFLLPGLVSCGNPIAAPEPRADKLAKSFCGCTEKLLALNQEAEKSADSLSFQKIAAESVTMHDCVQKLGIKKEEMAELKQHLNKICPALAGQEELLGDLLGN